MITDDIPIFLGLDVGKGGHWACTITKDGTKIWNKDLPNDDAKVTTVYQNLRAKGTVLVVADQAATIGALAIAVAQYLGTAVAYLPGLTMRRIADMYPGTAKTDEKMHSSSHTRLAACPARYAASRSLMRMKPHWHADRFRSGPSTPNHTNR